MLMMFPLPGSVVTPDAFAPDAELVKKALRHANLTPEKAALWYGTDRAQFHRQLNGEGHLSFTRLSQLPCSFKSWLGWMLVKKYGIPEEVQGAAGVELVLKRQQRTAAADERSA